MTAAQDAATRIRTGTPPALAIHIAAKEYGVNTHDVALGLAAMRHTRKRTTVPKTGADQWWDR